MECFPQEDTHETTAMDRSAFQHPDDRRQASMGSSLSVTGAMERGINSRKISKPRSAEGGQQ